MSKFFDVHHEMKCKGQQSYPFFINSARWRKSEDYFKGNYPLLHDFDWNHWKACSKTEEVEEDNKHVRIHVVDHPVTSHSLSCGKSLGRGRGETRGVKLDVANQDEVEFHCPNDTRSFGLKPLMQTVQRFYRSIVRGWSDDINSNVDEELGELIFNPSVNANLSEGPELNKAEVINQIIEEEYTEGNKIELHEISFESEVDHRTAKMVEMSEDANFRVHRRRGTGPNRLRRVPSNESEVSSNDSLVAGPLMIDFNEPLPNILENEEAHQNPISNGDVRIRTDLDVAVANAVSNTSRENLQTVVSQLGLEIPLQSKSSCHSPQHLHSSQQSSCCRHAAHNISIESLDLDTTLITTGGAGYCCGNPGNSKFGKRILSRRSCSFIH